MPERCPICGDPSAAAAPCDPCAGLGRWIAAYFAHRPAAARRVTAATRFAEELAAESLDWMNWILEAEEKLDIEIPDATIERFETVGDFIRHLRGVGATWPVGRDLALRPRRWCWDPFAWDVVAAPDPRAAPGPAPCPTRTSGSARPIAADGAPEAMTPTTLADDLAAFALRTRFDDLPGKVVAEARRRLIDAFGCAAGALVEPAPGIARGVARSIGAGAAGLIGGGRSSPDWAAFSNGVHIRYLDCNDTYLSLEPAHPSDNWAAVMAVGELVGATGRDWIAAAAVAYEVQCRLADAASIRARGWDHVTYGAMSTALASARLLGLDHARAVHALGIAGTTSPALRLTRAGELSMWKGCAFAHAARNGVFAALLAQAGMTGPAPLFEGDMGFWQQVSGPFELAQLGGPAAGDWMLPRTSIKFVPAEYHSQSAIAAAFEIRGRIEDLSQVESIEIATFRVAVEIIGQDPEKWRPQTRETADHSLPYCTAVALIDGVVAADQFHADRLRDPALLALVARTTVVEDPALTTGYPEGIPNRVTVLLKDGRSYTAEVAYPPGHDKNPLSDGDLAAKFHGLADPILGAERAAAIVARLARLDEDDRPHEAVALLDRPAGVVHP